MVVVNGHVERFVCVFTREASDGTAMGVRGLMIRGNGFPNHLIPEEIGKEHSLPSSSNPLAKNTTELLLLLYI